MKFNYILPLLALSVTTSAQAQTQRKDTTVNRTVVVEQEYNPDILDAGKVNVLPKVEDPTVAKGTVNYATAPAPASNIPASTLQPFMGKESQLDPKAGYARLGYGNYGNLDILGNYLFRFSGQDKLNLNLKVDGMDGKLELPEYSPWNAYYYRTQAGADYLHQFNKADLNVKANFGLSNFNYWLYAPSSKQKFTSGDVQAGIKSTDTTLPLQYHASAGLLMYQRQHDYIGDNLRETILRAEGGATAAINDFQRITIDMELNSFIYKGNNLVNYTLIELNPYYEWENDSWKIRLGAHTDIALGGMKDFHITPDVTAQYTFSDSYQLYAKATSGDYKNDFRRLEVLSPYATITQQPSRSNEQVNAVLGLKASPVTGAWFDVFAGYQKIEDDLREYQVAKNVDITVGYGPKRYYSFIQTNTSNIYAGLRGSYAWKDIFSIQADATYRHWKADTETALLMTPEIEFQLEATCRPLPQLLINAGYKHITRTTVADIATADPVNNLYAGAEYRLFNGIAIYARLNNLLNKSYSYYLGYPSEKLNFVGGLSFRF